MEAINKVSRLTPAQFKRIQRAAKLVARVSHQVYNFDMVFTTLVDVEHQRNESRREDIAQLKRANFR